MSLKHCFNIFLLIIFSSNLACQTHYHSYKKRERTYFNSRMLQPLLEFPTLSSKSNLETNKQNRDPKRNQIVEQARKSIGTKQRNWKDSAFFVQSLYRQIGIDVFSNHQQKKFAVQVIHDFVEEEGELFEIDTPQIGDMVFFKNTFDRNKNHQPDDGITLVGIVEYVEPDQTVSIITIISGTVLRYKMNRKQQNATRNLQTQKIVNHSFHAKYQSQISILTSLAFASYGSIL